jgi:uncharacterized cofD-like protein
MFEKQGWKKALTGRVRWLTVGMGVKRWLIVLAIGSAIAGMGVVYGILILFRAGVLPEFVYDWVTLQRFSPVWRMLILLFAGGIIILLAIVRLGSNLVKPFRRPGEDVAESLYRHSRRSRGPHIVAVGGGTGLPTLLRGLKAFTSNITAIVTVADDGGSSGRLRREFGLLPPGDFRNNLAALGRDETLLDQLFQYRFGAGRANGHNGKRELQGHAFGNLLLAALTGITGSFDEALLAAARVLAISGRVLPSTLEEVTLVAQVAVPAGESTVLERVAGESAIPQKGGAVQQVFLDPPDVRAYPPAVQAILQADLVVLGPGSLYTSILPNLLVQDLAQALRSTRAPVIYICNLATQPGETDNYDVVAHVEALDRHCPGCIDLVLANNNLDIPPETGGGNTVYVDPNWPPSRPKNCRLVAVDLVDETRPWRHDSDKLAEAILNRLA